MIVEKKMKGGSLSLIRSVIIGKSLQRKENR